MIGVLSAVFSGHGVDWARLLTYGNLASIGTVIALVSIVTIALNPTSVITGGSFAGVHALTVVGIAVFIALFALPNFAYMGLPTELNLIANLFLGFLATMSIYGMLRGE
jgi:hypothetical protein